jgi:hypothetical protein
MAQTISPVVTALSTYAGTHVGELFKKMVNGMEAARHFTVLPNVKDTAPLIKLIVSGGVRPFNSGTQFESALQYSDRKLVTGVAKKELLVDPEQYRGTYLSKYMGASANANVIPFEAFTAAEIVNMFGSELNDEAVYFGKDKSNFEAFDAAETYAAGDLITFTPSGDSVVSYYVCLATTSAGQTPTTHAAKWQKINARAVTNGIKHHLDAAITAGTIAQTTTGAINNTSVYALDVVRKVYQDLAVSYRKGLTYAYMSFDTFDLLTADIEARISKYTALDLPSELGLENALYVPGTNRKLIAVAASWMGASSRIICTPKENMILGCDLLGDANQIVTNSNLWTMEMGLKFNLGVNFAVTEAIAVNDQA